ncbi:MAG: leucine-rich repeat domain-containing protein, partial [Ruminiclostridium sp.]
MKKKKIIGIISGIDEKFTNEAAAYILVNPENGSALSPTRVSVSPVPQKKKASGLYALFGSLAAAVIILGAVMLPALNIGQRIPAESDITAATITSEDSFTVEISGGCAKILSYDGEEADVVIPEKIKGAEVRYIGENAFSSRKTLKSVVIPVGVTEIGERAFYGDYKLESVTLPFSVAVIGNYAFVGCKSLASIELPVGLEKIGDYAFENCGFT